MVHQGQSERGFTLVELMVAALVLVVGMLGVATLLSGGLTTTALNNQRVAATNLARELTEASRAAPYIELTPAGLAAAVQAQPNLGSGSPWQVDRRNTTYTVAADVCTFDDPADKVAATAVKPDNLCTPAATGPVGDANGDDFRRVGFTITWTAKGRPRTVRQTALIVNPSGGIGPRITAMALTPTLTIAPGQTRATIKLTTTRAETINWNADDGASRGNATADDATKTKWTLEWALGDTAGSDFVLDGTYSVIAQAFDDRSVPGDAKVETVSINRLAPFQPAKFAGGYNTAFSPSFVDLDWAPNPERDIVGYRVYDAGSDLTPRTGDDERVCPPAAQGAGAMLDPAVQSCIDTAPSGSAARYYAVALDRDLSDVLREGLVSRIDVGAPGSRPAAPSGPLTVQTLDSIPVLRWSAPASGTPAFYRIYRDGREVANRIGTASTGEAPEYGDGGAKGASHTYYVTAVDANYNESGFLGPVTWTR